MTDQLHLFGEGGHPSRPRQAKPSDPLFDALMQVTKTNPHTLTASGRGMANRALKEIRNAGGTPPEILHRSRAYVERFRHTPTPGALARHWASLEVRPHAARQIAPLEAQAPSQALSRSELTARAKAYWANRHA